MVLLPANGLMPATMPCDMVQDIVLARQAWQTHRVNASVAIGFWIAYANLSKLTKPVTAASLRACAAALLRCEKILATLLVLFIIVFSVFLFMNNTTATETCGSDRAAECGGAEALGGPADFAVGRF